MGSTKRNNARAPLRRRAGAAAAADAPSRSGSGSAGAKEQTRVGAGADAGGDPGAKPNEGASGDGIEILQLYADEKKPEIPGKNGENVEDVSMCIKVGGGSRPRKANDRAAIVQNAQKAKKV